MKFPFLPLLTMVAILLTHCSCTGWPRGWSRAKGMGATTGVAGAWTGTWKSDRNGHSGKLRCAVFAKSSGTYEYRYRASWAKFLCAGFTVDCQAANLPDGSWRVTGQRDLGPLFGGLFSHEGTVSGNVLKARYSAAVDEGTLMLERVIP